MHRYAMGFFLAALTSGCFIGGVQPHIEKMAKVATGAFTALFVLAEVASLFS